LVSVTTRPSASRRKVRTSAPTWMRLTAPSASYARVVVPSTSSAPRASLVTPTPLTCVTTSRTSRVNAAVVVVPTIVDTRPARASSVYFCAAVVSAAAVVACALEVVAVAASVNALVAAELSSAVSRPSTSMPVTRRSTVAPRVSCARRGTPSSGTWCVQVANAAARPTASACDVSRPSASYP
jgi:hypothetical protein